MIEAPLNPFIYKGLRGFNLFLGNFEDGQNVLMTKSAFLNAIYNSYKNNSHYIYNINKLYLIILNNIDRKKNIDVR